jgi:hypothetical protein
VNEGALPLPPPPREPVPRARASVPTCSDRPIHQHREIDFDTLERIPKLSAEWFREAARQNAVV